MEIKRIVRELKTETFVAGSDRRNFKIFFALLKIIVLIHKTMAITRDV